MNRWMGWMTAGTALLLAACTVPDLAALGPFSCESSSTCATGYTCVAGRCVRPGEEPSGPGPGASDGGTQPGGSDGGTQPGGEDGGTQPGEEDGGTQPGGSDGGTQPGGSDGGTQPGGSDGGTQPGGSDGGTQPGGSDGGTQPVDTTPPTLEMLLPTPSSRSPDGKTTYTELGSDGKALPAAWRRDQEVAVVLRTDTSLALSFTVTGGDGVALTLTAVRFTEGCSAVQCARVLVPMWAPRLDAMRGTFSLSATARDEAGNTTTRTGSLLVTRWKWAYAAYDASDSSDSIDGLPGIGETGTVFVTTYHTKMMALSPDGKALWSSPLAGEGVPVVGRQDDGRERVYVRGYWEDKSRGLRGHLLHVHDTASATQIATCPSPLVNELWIDSYALTSLDKSNSSVVAVTHSQPRATILFLRGSSGGTTAPCQSVTSNFWPSARGNVLVRGSAFFFSDGNGMVNSMPLGSAAPRTGFPLPSRTDSGINGLAVLGDTLVMGEGDPSSPTVGGVSVTGIDGGKEVVLRYSGGAVSLPILGSGNVAFGVNSRTGRMMRGLVGTTSSSFIQSSDTGFTYDLPPTLGQGGLLYAMRSRELGVWSATDLTARWRWTPYGAPTLSRVHAPTLDCTRDGSGNAIAGRPGVLYAAIHNQVHAIVVDSAGLDADAAWPKYQHDGRNSGNPDVPVVRCP